MKPGQKVEIKKDAPTIGGKSGTLWSLGDIQAEVLVDGQLFKVARKHIKGLSRIDDVVAKRSEGYRVGDTVLFEYSKFGKSIGVILSIGFGTGQSRDAVDSNGDEWDDLVTSEAKLQRSWKTVTVDNNLYRIRLLDTMGSVWVKKERIIKKLIQKPMVLVEVDDDTQFEEVQYAIRTVAAAITTKYKIHVSKPVNIAPNSKLRRSDVVANL